MAMLHALVERMVARLDEDDKLEIEPLSCTGERGELVIAYPARHFANEACYRVVITPEVFRRDGEPALGIGESHFFPIINKSGKKKKDWTILGSIAVTKAPRGWHVVTHYRQTVNSCYVPDHNHEMPINSFDLSEELADLEYDKGEDE